MCDVYYKPFFFVRGKNSTQQEMHLFITSNTDTLAFKLSVKLAWDVLWFAEDSEISVINHLSMSWNVKKLTFTCRIGRGRFVMYIDGSAIALNSVKQLHLGWHICFPGNEEIKNWGSKKLQTDLSRQHPWTIAVEITIMEILYSVENWMAANDVRYPFLLYVHHLFPVYHHSNMLYHGYFVARVFLW